MPTPEKAGASGTYSYTGVMSGFAVWGEGTCQVHFDESGSAGRMVATGPGSVRTPIGVQSRVDSENYTMRSKPDADC